MSRAVDVIAIIILALLAISVIAMPWPANAILGGVAVFSIVFAVIYTWRNKKKELARGREDESDIQEDGWRNS